MRCIGWIGLAMASCTASPCLAQSEAGSAGMVLQHGNSEQVARAMMARMVARQQLVDACWRFGCLVIVNESRSYDMVGLYVDLAKPGATPKWSRNQFGAPLTPKKATFRVKNGAALPCERNVRVVMRGRQDRERLTIEQPVAMCPSPHVDSLVRIRVAEPHVTVGPGNAE